MKLPTDYKLHGCDHPDVDPEALQQPSEEECQANLNRVSLAVSSACLNFTDLIISLFRGTLDCEKSDSKESWSWAVLQGTIWKAHGESVAAATPYLPGSFDRPPRNPAGKLTGGYKAWEFLLYIIGLAPALLHGILPDAEWHHLCKGVCVIRCFNQQKIPVEQLIKFHKLAIKYVAEFEGRDHIWPFALSAYSPPGGGFPPWGVTCKGHKGSLMDEYPIKKCDWHNFINITPQPPIDLENSLLSSFIVGQAANNETVSQASLAKLLALYAHPMDDLSNTAVPEDRIDRAPEAGCMQDFYISFVNDLNPGVFWLKYDEGSLVALRLQEGNIGPIADTLQREQINQVDVLEEFGYFG
ncbi:hypothetical protein B0H14DRAFT_3758298 [Mycena olivaceomarginata]|nr:hypothetical protein B0H14DRAFT_3758298 [Mycena olivaceomarginata]